MRILIVDDHRETRELLTRAVAAAGHLARATGSCGEARAVIDAQRFDVVVLDVMLPDGSGVDLCREIRGGGVTTPVLLLTARGQVSDRVTGLEAGADDYLAKPFAISELLARIRALARRGPLVRIGTVQAGPITIDLGGRRVMRDGRPVALTARELAIVEVLAMGRGALVPRETLLESVWGEATESARASLDVLVGRIRRKLGGAAAPIRTVRGIGYALESE